MVIDLSFSLVGIGKPGGGGDSEVELFASPTAPNECLCGRIVLDADIAGHEN